MATSIAGGYFSGAKLDRAGAPVHARHAPELRRRVGKPSRAVYVRTMPPRNPP